MHIDLTFVIPRGANTSQAVILLSRSEIQDDCLFKPGRTAFCSGLYLVNRRPVHYAPIIAILVFTNALLFRSRPGGNAVS